MISRLDGLILEVLGVAMIVPCAIYPQRYRHQLLVFCSVPLTAALAVLLKIAVLDVEPAVPSRHAMRRSNWTARGPSEAALIDVALEAVVIGFIT